MKFASIRGAPARPATTLLLAFSCLALAGFGSVDKSKPSTSASGRTQTGAAVLGSTTPRVFPREVAKRNERPDLAKGAA